MTNVVMMTMMMMMKTSQSRIRKIVSEDVNDNKTVPGKNDITLYHNGQMFREDGDDSKLNAEIAVLERNSL